MGIGKRIYELRKQQRLTQEQLAEKLAVSRQAVSKWESGQALPDMDKILLISEQFGVSTDYLLKGQSSDSSVQKANITGESLAFNRSVFYMMLATGMTLMSMYLVARRCAGSEREEPYSYHSRSSASYDS